MDHECTHMSLYIDIDIGRELYRAIERERERTHCYLSELNCYLFLISDCIEVI